MTLSNIDYWRLCDSFTIVQAALLIADCDPAEYEENVENWSSDNQPPGYRAARAALLNAVNSSSLKAEIVNAVELVHISDNQSDSITLDYPDVSKTSIAAEDIYDYLRARGFNEGFFFNIDRLKAVSMDASSPYYAPKLAAAIKAWTEVTNNPDLLDGKTPKKALEIWLRKHANEFGLTKDDGNPNQEGIEQICKVANWKPEGGAAPTPTRKRKAAEKATSSISDFESDEETPF